MTTFAHCVRLSTVLAIASATPALAGDHVKVDIASLEFSPSVVTARVGDTVEWVNKDIVDHTATARNGDFDVTAPMGKSARLRLKRPGKVVYYCRFHPNMIGTLHVLAHGK